MPTYPRTLAELAGALATWDDYSAIATAVRNLNRCTDVLTVEILENTDHTTYTHNLGSVPKGIHLMPVGDVGRNWYDETTVSNTIVDVYVANPPIGGSYFIKMVIYY